MSEVRILTNNDLNQYITLISNDSHTYSWDKLYFQHVSPNYLKHILSKEEEYCNILAILKMKNLWLVLHCDNSNKWAHNIKQC